MIDAMIERRTQAILDRLDGLLGYRSGSGNSEAHSKEATRKPVVNFYEHQTEEGPMGPQEEGVTHPATPLGVNGLGFPRISKEVLWAVSQSRTKDPREKHRRVGELNPQTRNTRTREQLSPATRKTQEGRALTSNLKRTDLNCVMTKK